MKRTMLRPALEAYFPLSFQISQKMWDTYSVSELLSAQSAAGMHPLVSSMHELAARVNHSRPGQVPLHAGQLLAAGLLQDIQRFIVDAYCTEDYPGVFGRAMDDARTKLGKEPIETTVAGFVSLYPPQTVRDGALTEDAYIESETDEQPNRYAVGRELILLHIAMANPAMTRMQHLYDDAELQAQTPSERVLDSFERFFTGQPAMRGFSETLLEFLRLPIKHSPHSLMGQLDYIFKHWARLLPDYLLERLTLASDILREENQWRGHGPGPARVLEFLDLNYDEPAAFTFDKDWMSNVVLMAKCVYVWLDQLSKTYQRPIVHLDDIPDEELDRLARWGFSGLWLIGVWERSPASQKIKQLMGNPEALSSAYSLHDYVIAADLGGQAAYENLHDRAWKRGIRLASDMVPNHVGLYSKWVVEHPDWFMQSAQSPFPSYSFNGPDLSWDDRVCIQIEDGYWDHRDAAVVFRRIDKWSGDTRYIYHGNDGTNMPWNDTAQLNFLIPEVRQAVLEAVLHVARMFPILRFDAAMTLTKRHYQRLWFPQPGEAGAIPSRAQYGMTRPQFDEVFPKEFWREVVDRIQEEAPETLLIAEAFWLMEGFFVRTLGMHRVYNSAFMNMLKMEENLKYRATIRNVLEFSPEVVKRFVNFMNNPDELTAVEQFGRDDKYYGVAMMMVTMPGLPMFGHGQIEGFTERYGMEYRRAYWDEPVDEHMVRRHEREIFPLMKKRHLFSGSENYALYDFVVPEGWTDENVFAYSNRSGGERALIIYNNAYSTTRGRITTSTAINLGDADNKILHRKSLAEALALNLENDCFYIFRDHRTNLEYIRHAGSVAAEGLEFELHAYQYYAFLDWREIHDTDGSWGRLAWSLEGRGLPSIEDAYKELLLEPLHGAFRKVVNVDTITAVAAGEMDAAALSELKRAYAEYAEMVTVYTDAVFDVEELIAALLHELEAVGSFAAKIKKVKATKRTTAYLLSSITGDPEVDISFWKIPIALAFARQTGLARLVETYAEQPTDIADLLLSKVIREAFTEIEQGDQMEAQLDTYLVEILATFPGVLDFVPSSGGAMAFRRLFASQIVQKYLMMNMHNGVVWLNQEQAERLVYWLLFESVVSLLAHGRLTKQALETRAKHAAIVLEALEQSGYQVEKWLDLLKKEA